MKIGLVHPGAMGAALGAALVGVGQEVVWASEGRSPATARRADDAGLTDVASVSELANGCDLVVSVCPPHAAVELAATIGALVTRPPGWRYVDANAIAPSTARRVAEIIDSSGGRFIDGGIIGPPPVNPGTTRLYLSGEDAIDVSVSLGTPLVEVHVVSDEPGAASGLKLAYAAWTKGSAALLLTARAAARRAGVEDGLLVEWRTSQPGLVERWEEAHRAAAEKGWRWAGEMEEIASMFGDLGLATGFHSAAAEVFRRPPE
jgi:3-hydroxyisobutyrate dehydrogenase-like beta-hydroxyacid dehydrogenase